jgi:hypothetical protein
VALVATALLVVGVGTTGCSVVNKVRTAVHDVKGNKATIDAFSSKVQSGAATTFEATYVTTGSAPATIVYAVQPPTGLAFTDTPTGSSGTTADIVVNSSGEYSCTPASGSGPATCEKLGAASAKEQNQLFDFYTPSHWVAFLKDFSLVAGIAGDKVTNSTMSLNGFSMSCVDFQTPGTQGLSTICTTAQGILGYVKVVSDATSFAITKYSSSPPASLFQLPPGATITTPSTTPSTGGSST